MRAKIMTIICLQGAWNDGSSHSGDSWRRCANDFVDTSALYALVDADDANHSRVVAFLQSEGARPEVCRDRCYPPGDDDSDQKPLGPSSCHARARRYPAKRQIRNDADQRIRMVRDVAHFQRFADKTWSPFDCSCLAVAQAGGLPKPLPSIIICDRWRLTVVELARMSRTSSRLILFSPTLHSRLTEPQPPP